MSAPIINSDDIAKKLSRRYMLRNSAITATGVALLPSIITGCNKDVWQKVKEQIPGGGVGSTPSEPEPTPEELAAAAVILRRMQAMLYEVYHESYDYDEVAFHALAATEQPSTWTNFIVDLFIDVAIAMIATAAAATGPQGFALFVPALAGVSSFLHDWGIGKDRPLDLAGLNGAFAEYQKGQLAMRDAVDHHLGHLTDETNNYANLRLAWKDPVPGFNGETYTLHDLAKSSFPDKQYHYDEYAKIYEPMHLHQQKAVWNLLIMKCCGYWQYTDTVQLDYRDTFTRWARRVFYPNNPGRYLRGKKFTFPADTRWYNYSYWNLGIGDNPFPNAASNILFIDDTPEHKINDNGLFNRSYVFEQFSPKKYRKLTEYHEIATDDSQDFATLADDWKYTGGMFNRLVEVDPA